MSCCSLQISTTSCTWSCPQLLLRNFPGQQPSIGSKKAWRNVSVEGIKVPQAAVEEVPHLQQILAVLQPAADFGVSQLLFPITIIVIVHETTIPVISTLDSHFIVSAFVVASVDARCLLHRLAQFLNVVWDTSPLLASVVAPEVLEDNPNDLHPHIELELRHAPTHTLPIKDALTLVRILAQNLFAESRSNVGEIDNDVFKIVPSALAILRSKGKAGVRTILSVPDPLASLRASP
mmetsp:Transcript_38823/g.103060  ORF Transcript_38823/g.103060 Transcript_38823/m.103060 type:complete len:235 (+) Transcript_38823:416-1120(+)